MSIIFEIAYAAAKGRLCLFTGTGFSKAVTGDSAPGWQDLLETLCDRLDTADVIKSALFPKGEKHPLSLEESAQVLSIEMSKYGKNIYHEIEEILRSVSLVGDNSAITLFMKNSPLSIVTTNYDKFAEELAGNENCLSMAPGLPIPRSQAKTKVFHIHGSIDSPEHMVVTSEDYFRFMNTESYFSKKLSTILHENTVVIIGYSLGDTNLKAIINDYKGFVREHVIGGNIFFVSRSKTAQCIKDYYAHCYGIRMLDQKSIHDFFRQVATALPQAKDIAEESVESLKNVLTKNYEFTTNYLKLERSFFEIVSSFSAYGCSLNDVRVVEMLGKVIKKKISLTKETGAWDQYEHLAQWLTYLGSILDMSGISIKDIFLDAVFTSMDSMSHSQKLGYSWHAYGSWNNRWTDILPPNRAMIRKYIESKISNPDALHIVRRG